MLLRMLISEAFEKFRVDYIVYNNQSAKTEEMNRLACRSLLEFTGDIDIKDLTFDKIRKWKEQLQRTRSPNTVRGYIIKLRVVLKHLAVQGYKNIINYEAIGVPKRNNKLISFLSPDQVTAFINAALNPAGQPLSKYHRITKIRNATMISLLYSSGIRVSELCSLDRSSIDVESGTFSIVGKGNKPRLCFTDERTLIYLNRYLSMRKDTDSALFVSKAGRMNRNTVSIIFQEVSKHSGIAAHPHTMRHSFATNLLRNNTNLLFVSKFLGHSSVQTTEMYTHVVDEDLRRIYLEKHTI